jgi:lipoate-protein ligase A
VTSDTANWRLIVERPLDGAVNMATDRALLDVMEGNLLEGRAPLPILRLYAWDVPTVSTGRHQPLDEACDLEACRSEGVPVVQRPTGGRAVLHDDEVTYAVIAPAQGRFGGAGVTAASAVLSQALAHGLRELGADVASVRGTPATSPRAAREACFLSASRAEIVVSGRKLCGSAQFRGRGAFLQHGSLPIVFDAERQARLLRSDAALLRSHAIGLAEALGRRPEVGEIHAAIEAGVEHVTACRFERGDVTHEESERAGQLAVILRAESARFLPAGAPRA